MAAPPPPPSSAPITYRPAVNSDLPSIASIYNYAVRETSVTFDTEEKPSSHFEAYVSGSKTHRLLVAEATTDDKTVIVVGFGGVSPFKDRKAYDQTAELTLYVHPEWQGRGIGSGLLGQIHDGNFLEGLHTVLGLIVTDNMGSRRLVERWGYVYRGEIVDVGFKFGKYHSVTFYQRDL